jgi:hypothetical protein
MQVLRVEARALSSRFTASPLRLTQKGRAPLEALPFYNRLGRRILTLLPCSRSSAAKLTHYVDAQVTTQVLVGILTLEIGFTGIHMSFAFIVKVVLSIIFGHDITYVFLMSVDVG